VTTYHTFDIDNVPPPSDFELEAADRRKRTMPDWLHDAIVEMQGERDEKETQQDAMGVLF
jgi:hypothetical protein